MYENKRPSRQHIESIITWLEANGIHLYSQCCNIDTGQQYGAQMDVKSTKEIIGIYNHNRKGTWWRDDEY